MVGQVHRFLRKGFSLMVLLLCLLGLLVGWARVAMAQGWRSPWRTFTTADGLASGTVTAIHQTQDGILWFGTMQGLSRYNGEWKTYTTADGLAHNEVTAIFEDQEGSIWVGTRGGLNRHDGEWSTVTPSERSAGKDFSAIIQLEDGTLWFGTLDGGITRLRAGEWRTFATADGLPNDCITAVTQDRRGDIWVGTASGLGHYDGRGWKTYTTTQGFPDSMVTAILATEDGAIWVGTLSGLGSFRPDMGGASWQTFLPQDGLAGEHVTALAEDSEGILWVATTEGVSLYESQQWSTWTQRDGLASSDVRAIHQDSDGGLWFGTSAGVSYCDFVWRLHFLPHGGEGESRISYYDVSALVQARSGALWIATLGGGVARYQDGHWHTYTSAEGLAADDVFALAEDRQGALWFATAGGVSCYLAETWETYTTTAGLPTNVVLSVEVASDGTLWFGTAGGGVVRYRSEEGWRTFDQRHGLADNYVRAICEAGDGALWLGTSKGVNRFDGHSWQLFTSQSTNRGLPGDEVRAIWCASDGSLWFATDQGAATYDGSSWRKYDKGDGLPSNSVNTVWKGERGDIWFGTSSGLCRSDGRTWKVYAFGQPLPSSHILSMLQSAPDTWWIGTTDGGLICYRPERTPPWTRVARINDRPILTRTLTLPADERFVVASFVGGDTHTEPEQLLYMHKLEGVREDWTYGRERFGQYSDLTPGTYTLWLVARDADFNYSKPYSVTITIRPPRVYAPAPTIVSSTATPVVPAPTTESSNPTSVPKPMPVSSLSESGPPLGYSWLGLPLLLVVLVLVVLGSLAVMGIGYWVYGRWRGRQAVRRGFNPYICGPPIHDEDMFFGREALLWEILQMIHNNNIIIYGERRIGKTTVLYQLRRRLKRLEDSDYAFFPTFINLQGIPQDRLFLLLAHSIAREVEDEVGSPGLICRSGGRERTSLSPPGLEWRPARTGYNHFDFQEDLTAIVQALQGTTSKEVRLILLVDEADVIGTYDQTVQEQLRGVLMGSLAQQVKVILAGTYISKEWHLQSSPWYNLFSREIMLRPFEVEEVERLIRQPVQGIYRYDQEAIERIVTYSEQKPFEAQKLSLYAVKEMLERKKRRVTASEVEAALRSTLEERAPEFEQMWDALSPAGQRALQVLVSGSKREQTLPRLPLSEEDRKALVKGGVLHCYQKQEHLLTAFREWVRRKSF